MISDDNFITLPLPYLLFGQNDLINDHSLRTLGRLTLKYGGSLCGFLLYMASQLQDIDSSGKKTPLKVWGSPVKIWPITEYPRIGILASDCMRKTIGCLVEPEILFSVFLGISGIQVTNKKDSLFVAWIFVPERWSSFSKTAGTGIFKPWCGRPIEIWSFEHQVGDELLCTSKRDDWRLGGFQSNTYWDFNRGRKSILL